MKGSQSDSKKGWPVRLALCESAIRKQDEYVFKESRGFVDLVVSTTEKHVQKNRRTDALEFLSDQGCPRPELLYLLGMCENRGVTNSLRMTGYNSSELRQKLHHLKECASVIERLNGYAVPKRSGGTEFGKFLEMAEVKIRFHTVKGSTLARFLQLPSDVHEYTSLIEHAAKYLGGKADFYLSLAKALLTGFVQRHTNEHHDSKVATLLSVMLGSEYGEVEHRVWRNKYKDRLNHYQPDPTDPPSLRAKKTLLECEAAVSYRMDVLHPGEKYIRQEGSTALRLSDFA